jgi:hypothetical protein
MPFKVVFLAHAPDADPEKHRSVIDTGKYKLYSVVVRTHAQAVEECKKLIKDERIHSILLCSGFTHKNTYEIVEAVNNEAGIFVARGDGPSNRITALAKKEHF